MLALLDDHPDFFGGVDALAGADGGPQGHDGGAARFFQFLGQHGVGVDVGKHGEPVFDQQTGGFQGCRAVGEQVLGVGDYLEFHQVGLAYFPAQTGDEEGLFDGGATGGVGEYLVLVPVDVVQQRLFGGVVQVEPADGDGDHLHAGGFDGFDHLFHSPVSAGAEDETRLECSSRDYQVV